VTTPTGQAQRWASKVEQLRLVHSADPRAAFSAKVFGSPTALASHLREVDHTVVLRPEFSTDSGSALLHRPDVPMSAADLRGLWSGVERVVAHEWVPGEPYFVNGVVVNGGVLITDGWRCFELDEDSRSLLTSVLNVAPDAGVLAEAQPVLDAVVAAAELRHGPVHFELIRVTGGGMKVVKFAPRVAGEPLASLCRMLGIPGQVGTVAVPAPPPAPTGFVADYSFVARVAGRLACIDRLREIRSRPCYRRDLRMPSPGDWLARSESGERPAATILLQGPDEAAMLADISYYQARNADGIFVLA
jgi:hypothetical protein